MATAEVSQSYTEEAAVRFIEKCSPLAITTAADEASATFVESFAKDLFEASQSTHMHREIDELHEPISDAARTWTPLYARTIRDFVSVPYGAVGHVCLEIGANPSDLDAYTVVIGNIRKQKCTRWEVDTGQISMSGSRLSFRLLTDEKAEFYEEDEVAFGLLGRAILNAEQQRQEADLRLRQPSIEIIMYGRGGPTLYQPGGLQPQPVDSLERFVKEVGEIRERIQAVTALGQTAAMPTLGRHKMVSY